MQYRVAVPIVGPTLKEVMQQGHQAVEQGADILEIRLDCLKDSEIDLKAIVLSFPSKPKIITARHAKEAGPDIRAGWKGRQSKRIELLQEAADRGADYVDIELDHFHPIKINRERTKLIVSYHNFDYVSSIPALNYHFRKAVKKGADIVKLATKVCSERTSEDLLDFVESHKERCPLIVIGMGELGKKTRFEGPRRGGYLTFARLDPKSSTASGQPTVKELREYWIKT